MVETRIKSFYGKLSPTENKISNYILNSTDDLRHMTSTDVADKLGISQSNVIRFVKKIGYSGYRDFQLDITPKEIELKDKSISASDSTGEIVQKISSKYVDVINVTAHMLNEKDLEKCVKYITKAHKIAIFGVGSSGLIAEAFANNLVKIGLNIYQTTNAHVAFSTVSGMNSKDVIVLISESGETRDILKLANIAKDNNTPIIAITRLAKSPLRQAATISLSSFNDQTESRINVTAARSSQLFVVDLLYTLILTQDYNKYIEKITYAETQINGTRV